MINTLETIIKVENEKEAEEIKALIEEMDKNERKEFLLFLQGAKFTRNLYKETKIL